MYTVQNYLGTHGYYSVVLYDDEDGNRKDMPATVFLTTFEPLGRKFRVLDRCERLLRGPARRE